MQSFSENQINNQKNKKLKELITWNIGCKQTSTHHCLYPRHLFEVLKHILTWVRREFEINTRLTLEELKEFSLESTDENSSEDIRNNLLLAIYRNVAAIREAFFAVNMINYIAEAMFLYIETGVRKPKVTFGDQYASLSKSDSEILNNYIQGVDHQNPEYFKIILDFLAKCSYNQVTNNNDKQAILSACCVSATESVKCIEMLFDNQKENYLVNIYCKSTARFFGYNDIDEIDK